jgi:hypothetical protein
MECERSTSEATFSGLAGFVKLGQPLPDSNLSSDLKSSALQAAHR